MTFNGIVTTFPSVGLGIEPGGSVLVTVGYTHVQSWAGTPRVVRWFLPDLVSGKYSSPIVDWNADPTGANYVGRHASGNGYGFCNAGNPSC